MRNYLWMREDTLDLNNGVKKGYKRVFERYPQLESNVRHFDLWLRSVEEWLTWIDKNIEDNIHASRSDVLENFHLTPLGLEILERLGIDIHPAGRNTSRVEYDIKKLLRAVVCLPTIARLKGKRLDRKYQIITQIFKEIIDSNLNGRFGIEGISDWADPHPTQKE